MLHITMLGVGVVWLQAAGDLVISVCLLFWSCKDSPDRASTIVVVRAQCFTS